MFVQELWLFACELSLLSKLSDSFNVFAQSGTANSEQSGIVKGRPFGGVAAVFICRSLCKMASLGAVDDNGGVVCVKLVTGNLKMLFFGCYFPFNDKLFDYTNRVADVCGFIESVCYDFSDYKVCVMGDLNFECNTSIGVGTGGRGGPGPLTFLFGGPNMTMAPTFEKCRPIFESKVTPYFQS